jgi:hypothetical protein
VPVRKPISHCSPALTHSQRTAPGVRAGLTLALCSCAMRSVLGRCQDPVLTGPGPVSGSIVRRSSQSRWALLIPRGFVQALIAKSA